MADTAYDADRFRAKITPAGAAAVILCNPSRATKLPLDPQLYKERDLVECRINKLKHFRRIASRCEKVGLPPKPLQPGQHLMRPKDDALTFRCDYFGRSVVLDDCDAEFALKLADAVRPKCRCLSRAIR